MAQNTGKVTKDDIFEPGITREVIRDFLALQAPLTETLDKLSSILDLTQQLAKKGNTRSSQGIKDMTEAYATAKTSTQLYNDVLQKNIELQEKLAILESGMADENIQLEKTIRQLRNEKARDAETTSKQIGVYRQAVNQLYKVKGAILDLMVAGKQNTAEFKKMIITYEQLNKTVRDAEAAVGQYQRNVGNYTNGQKKYNYEMFQMTQIMRELPNFAISSRIGIMALSNNLPQLGDAFKKIATDINETTGKMNGYGFAMKTMLKSVFSWQSALLIGITIAIQYADKIGDMVASLFRTVDANKRLKEIMGEVNEAGKTALVQHEKEIALLRTLLGVAQNEALAKNDRKNAIEGINKISPEYLGFITEENVKTKEANEAIDIYIYKLQQKARAQAAFAQLVAVNEKIFAAEVASENYINEKDAKDILGEDLFNQAVSKGQGRADRTNSYRGYGGETVQAEISIALLKLAVDLEKQRVAIQNKINEFIAAGTIPIDDPYVKPGKEKVEKEPKAKKEKKVKEEKDGRLANDLLMSKLDLEAVDEAEGLQKLRAQTDANLLKQHAKTAEEWEKIDKDLQDKLIQIQITANERRIAIMSADNYVGYDSVENIKKLRAEIELLKSQLGLDKPDKDTTKKDKVKDRKELVASIISLTKEVVSTIERMEQQTQRMLDREIDATKRKQDTLKMLAAQGTKDAKDNLAYEERKQAELERRKEQIARTAARRAATIAAFTAYANKAARGDTDALPSTLGDLTAILGFLSAAAFHEGTERVGGKKILHNRGGKRDPLLAWFEPDEKVFSAADSALIPEGMSNRDVAMLAATHKLPSSGAMGRNDIAGELIEEVKELRKDVRNQRTDFHFNEQQKIAETTFDNGMKIVRTFEKANGIRKPGWLRG